MRHILLATLFLGCFTLILAQRGTFEFKDSNGQCWRCSPGFPCEKCRNIIPQNQCDRPDCNDPNNRGSLFPSPTLRKYYQCVPNGNGNWVVAEVECPCNTLFNYATQRCEFPWDFVPVCNFDISDPTVIDCDTTTGPDDTTTTVDTTTNETTTDSTTSVTTSTTSTPKPCVCVIWFPCPCNPCWMSRHPSCLMIG